MDRTDALELWGGVECTLARVQDGYRDQLEETGCRRRSDDLARIAALGIRTVRFPVLWESVAPERPDARDFRWHDERLAQGIALGLQPILGLVHHGSGPRYTDLLDPGFVTGLAAHARAVAQRYPWARAFTPVNEPLTTARFSGLYGHWHPHGRDVATFLRCLMIQCQGVLASMRAIREVTPDARLVQTEDLGKTFSTPALSRQAAYENERRWLSFDLLCGRVDLDHPWRKAFLAAGVRAAELDDFLSLDAAPDIIGINHYLTSERYLDETLDAYPAHLHGGNSWARYADAEAVRIAALEGEVGPKARLREAWERYGRPIAVTEAHHGCTRDEQLRWLVQVWREAQDLRAEGADVRAVTIWSLFGAVDWNSLLTQRTGFYEAGAFDVRSDPPRPTALANAAASLAKTGSFAHPVLDSPGWWRRPERCYGRTDPVRAGRRAPRRELLVTGAGTLGRAIARICEARGLAVRLLSRADLDIADPGAVSRTLSAVKPWAVVNTAGFVRVADAARERDRCFRENVTGAAALAGAAGEAGVPFVTFSTDLVFDGVLGRPYVESDPTNPGCTYGASKAEAERAIAALGARALVIRTSAFFGPWDRYNFVHHTLETLGRGERLAVSERVSVSPTYVPDLAHAALDLLIDGETGVWHVANQGAVSWFGLAKAAASAAGLGVRTLAPIEDDAWRSTALGSERGLILPPWEGALHRYMREREAA